MTTERIPAARRGYVICSDARSGSTFLSRVLISTGVLGVPKEYFHDPRWIAHLRRSKDGLEQVLDQASTPNGVFALKVFPPHFDHSRRLGWAELPGLGFVELRRADILGQAISTVRARQTGQWLSTQPAVTAPRYSRGAITDALARIAHGRARWECYFARNAITPLRLTYEEAHADPQRAVDAVAFMVGIERPFQVDPAALELEMQRDELSEAWRDRYISECSDRSYLDRGWMGRWLGSPIQIARKVLGT